MTLPQGTKRHPGEVRRPAERGRGRSGKDVHGGRGVPAETAQGAQADGRQYPQTPPSADGGTSWTGTSARSRLLCRAVKKPNSARSSRRSTPGTRRRPTRSPEPWKNSAWSRSCRRTSCRPSIRTRFTSFVGWRSRSRRRELPSLVDTGSTVAANSSPTRLAYRRGRWVGPSPFKARKLKLDSGPTTMGSFPDDLGIIRGRSRGGCDGRIGKWEPFFLAPVAETKDY